LEQLRERETFHRYLEPLRQKEWIVYSKAPFAGPEQVLDYVGRYTHRVAIANSRLLNIEDGHVAFRWKDYRDGGAQKTMTLTAEEFIRRFLLHVLPPGLQRIRYYGFLGNRYRKCVFRSNALFRIMHSGNARSARTCKTCVPTSHDLVAVRVYPGKP
jgi:hypothetical protein